MKVKKKKRTRTKQIRKRRRKKKRPQRCVPPETAQTMIFFERNVARNREAIESKKIRF